MKSRSVILTGASGTLGRKLAVDITANGFLPIFITRKLTSSFESFVQSYGLLKNDSPQIYEGDFRNDDELNALCDKIRGDHPVLYGLINNAGVAHGGFGPLVKTTEIDQVFKVNFIAPVTLANRLMRCFQKNKSASIVNISSIQGIVAQRGNIAYGSSKAALNHATRIMAREFAPFGVRVNAVCPSAFEGSMGDEMDSNNLDELLAMSAKNTRISIESVSKIVITLLGDTSLDVTGQVIRVDGGMQF